MSNQTENNAAIIHAQQLMQQLRMNYLAELPDRINELEQRTLDLKRADDFAQQYEELYRKIHSLKGSAGTYGLQIISSICHQLEDTITCIANDSSKVDDSFLDRCIAYLDLMRDVIKETMQGKTSFREIEAALARMRAAATEKHLTALLVESSRVNSALYLGTLKSLPIQFSVVDSGYAALGLLLHSHYDLLITGQETPMLNGFSLIAAMRLNQGLNHDIHAMLLTSSSNLKIPPAAMPVTIINRDARIGAELFREVQSYLYERGVT